MKKNELAEPSCIILTSANVIVSGKSMLLIGQHVEVWVYVCWSPDMQCGLLFIVCKASEEGRHSCTVWKNTYSMAKHCLSVWPGKEGSSLQYCGVLFIF